MIAQLRGLGALRLGALAGVALLLLGLLGWLALRAGQPPMALLYGELDPRDAGQVVASLERQRVPYRLAGGGTQVLVPETEVARLRLVLAREGVPAGGSIGYEIFDRGESLTTTPFQQDVNRLRALEGELARSIRTLSGVRGARVHLVLPRREPFARERGEAQASVVLTMQGAQRLDREGVQAVLHLVAAAVPGLRPQQVSIVDSRGELLARGGQALAGAASAANAEELRRAHEARIARAVEEMLERTLGVGRVRAEAAVEMDFDRVQTTEERYDPENQVPRSTQSSTESSRSGEGGSVSVANQLPGAEANGGGATTQESKQEETTNFEIGRTVRNILREQPQLRRLSVAVLVDGVYEPQPNAAPRFRERSAEELARLAALVRSAVGADERRGDRVEVVSLRFAEPDAGSSQSAGLLGLDIGPAMTARLMESGILALVALLAILLVGRPVANRLAASLAPRTALVAAGVPAALAGPDGVAALPGAAGGATLAGATGTPTLPAAAETDEQMVSLAMVAGQVRSSSLHQLTQLVERHPDETLTVLRRWLAPEEG